MTPVPARSGQAGQAAQAGTGKGLSGLLVVDKPAGVTSHDMVMAVRALAPGVKVGHFGTLDPAATGLLLVAVGRATEEAPRLLGSDKEYDGTVRFGVRTSTDDLEGDVLERKEAPPLREAEIEALLARFRGRILQRAPDVSALKHKGETFHAMVRRGEQPPVRARDVMVHELSLLGAQWPEVEIHVRCGGGTYIRSLARDLGDAAGCGAALAALRRTRVGPFTLAGAWTLSAIRAATPESLVAALRDVPPNETPAQ